MLEYAVALVAILVLIYVGWTESFDGAPRLTSNCACKDTGPVTARINPFYWPDSGTTCTPLFSPNTPDHVELI